MEVGPIMKRTLILLITFAILTGLTAGYSVDSGSLSCPSYTEHSIDVSGITYDDDGSNNGNTERYMSPGEDVTLRFSYNLPACDNAVDHSSHVINFYNGDGDLIGTKYDLQMKQGNWDSYTTYEIPITIPEFDTDEIRVELDVRASSVHGSDTWYESDSEESYDKVIQDTVDNRNNFNFDELPISDGAIQMLKNTETTSNVQGSCDNLDYTINNDSYVSNPNMPGLRIDSGNWNMDSGGGHPCYYFTAYAQALSLYNFFDVVDYNGEGDGNINKAGTCGPNPNNQHNGGGVSLGQDRTFERACPDDNGEWIDASKNTACDDGTKKEASNNENQIIEVDSDGETIAYVSDGSQWHSVQETDTEKNVCEAFTAAQGNGGWVEGDVIAEDSGLAGAPCNLPITQDTFIVGQTLYENGDAISCTGPAGVKRNVTIQGETYYCRGVSN